jgi:hypothetical protein
MRRAQARELLDDPFFLAELEKVEIDDGTRYCSLPDVGDGCVDDDGRDGSAGAEWPAAHPVFHDPRSEPIAVGRVVLAVGGFLMMMLVGAAAAAVLFHHRIALILG